MSSGYRGDKCPDGMCEEGSLQGVIMQGHCRMYIHVQAGCSILPGCWSSWQRTEQKVLHEIGGAIFPGQRLVLGWLRSLLSWSRVLT